MDLSPPDGILDMLRRMIRLERAGLREIGRARKIPGTIKRHVPYEMVLWCHDHGLVDLQRGAFDIVDWTYFRVTPKGFAAVGEPVPPWK
jgi:hypothetical protein